MKEWNENGGAAGSADEQKSSREEDERTDDVSGGRQNQQTAESQQTAQHQDTAQDHATTYHWVNPKLRGAGRDVSPDSPWNSSSGDNYWHYTENESGTDGGNRSTDSRNSGRSDGYSGGSPYGGSYSGSGYGQYGGPQGTGNGTGYSRKPERGHRRDSRKKRGGTGRGRKVLNVIGTALVFGAVAGLVMYGVYALANTIRPVGAAAEAEKPESSSVASSSADNTVSGSSAEAEGPVASAGSSDTGENMSVAEVAKNCMPSLVTIGTISVEEMQSFFGGTQQYKVQGAGTGVIIGENDTELLIATNNHVVSGAEQVTVGFIDESAISATVKGTDASNDLAVVSVNLDDIPDSTKDQISIIAIGNSDDLVLGQQVVAIGNALGYGQSVTSGYISALNRSLTLSDGTNTFTSSNLIQTDAAINSGNSGGALLNLRGELIGINEAKSGSTSTGASVDNVGYAIPMEKAQPILNDLMNQKTRTLVDEENRGYLGASFADVTSEYAKFYQMPEGVCVTSVIPGGPAEKAGLRQGDVITALDGMNIMTYDAMSERLDYYSAGEQVEVTYSRAVSGRYEEQKTTVTLTTRSEIDKLKR